MKDLSLCMEMECNDKLEIILMFGAFHVQVCIAV